MLSKLKAFYENLTPTKILCIAIVAVVWAITLFAVKDNIGDWWHGHKAEQFNAQMAEAQKKVQALEIENGELRGQIQSEMAHGKALEIDRDAYKQQLEAFGKQGQAAVKAQEEAAKQYEIDKQNISTDSTLYDRCESLCAERKALGFKCPASYCEQYRGR